MPDKFSSFSTELDSPAGNAYEITPNNTVDLSIASRSIYVGAAGNIYVTTIYGNTVPFIGCAAGSILPIRASRVWANNTTASNLICLY